MGIYLHVLRINRHISTYVLYMFLSLHFDFLLSLLWLFAMHAWHGTLFHITCLYEGNPMVTRLFSPWTMLLWTIVLPVILHPGRPCDVSEMWYEKTISWNMKIISFHDSESGHDCPQMSLHVWMLGYQEDHGELSNTFILDFPWPLIPCSVSIFKQFVYRGYSANDPRCLVRILLHFEAQQIRTLLLSWFN